MNSRRIARLQDIAQAYPLDRKVLVTGSHAIGHQWLERLCREYNLVQHIDAATPRSLIERFARLPLREKGVALLSQEDAYWLVHRLMGELAAEAQPFVPLAMLSPGVVQIFSNAISELRQALVRSERLTPGLFESASKGEYIIKLLAGYERHLERHRLADETELCLYVEPDPQPRTLYVLDRHVQLSAAMQEALRTIAGERLLMLEADLPFTVEDKAESADVKTELFHALGPVAEVREVFRRLSDRGIPLDQAEIVTPNSAVYTTAVYTEALEHGIPCTFSGGIPIDYTMAGQAVRLYLDWLESGYHLEPILQALKQGLMRPPAEEEAVTMSSFIRVLEKSGIGWGRERYGLLRLADLPSTAVEITGADTDTDADADADADTAARVEGTPARRLADWFDSWFAALPAEEEASWSPGAVAAGLSTMLESVPARDVDEAQAQAGLRQLVQALKQADIGAMDRELAIRFVREWAERLTFGANGIPSEGKLHVSSLQDGGQTGRPYTFLMGMDEKSWATGARQDPVLLDEERTRIDATLMTAKERAELEESTRAERLGAVRGSCTMSFSSFWIADKQERNAAFELLLCYRRDTGNAAAGYEDLLHALPPAVGVLHSSGSVALDSQEVWLKSLIGGKRTIRDGLRELLAAYPSLLEGRRAVQSRKGLEIGEYDGVFEPGGYEPVPAASSVSKLELFARCPLQYFYREVLRVRPKELAEFDRSRWLDAAQRGTLLHAIYQLYWTETNEQGGSHDRARLDRITEEQLRKAQEEIPAPSEHVMRKECEHIRRDAGIFWNGERIRSSKPRFMELQLHQAEEPFTVELGEELKLPLRGYVDRVDELAPHTYKILDYKTGSSRKYREDGYFAGGTQLQHAVYAAAVEQWLRQSGLDPEARVTQSGYYFPTFRGQGHEISRIQNRLEDLAHLVDRMLEAMRQGVFPPTQDAKMCSWCDYRDVCGRHAELMKDKRKDPGNDARLAPLREVESYA